MSHQYNTWYHWHPMTWFVGYFLLSLGVLQNVLVYEIQEQSFRIEAYGWPLNCDWHIVRSSKIGGGFSVDYGIAFLNILIVLILMLDFCWLLEKWQRNNFQFRILDLFILTLWTAGFIGCSRYERNWQYWGSLYEYMCFATVAGLFIVPIAFENWNRLMNSSRLNNAFASKTPTQTQT